ncbi:MULTISPECIES: DUF4244 domain-containing protein [unclassified Luteococcus]|uniref:DUF4244 domain-containing protein n=1 Tax=unclassified Luteococcus TaxID=2639923 RepID=UPI00313AA73B
MSASTITPTEVEATQAGLTEQTSWAQPEVAFRERPLSRTRRACQRGMVTAEYAVGILAAIALALVLVKVFNDNSFFRALLKQVTVLIGQVGQKLPAK